MQTEGEIVTVKPKRYSQRSKNVDPTALREKVRETMSMEGKLINKTRVFFYCNEMIQYWLSFFFFTND